MEIREIFDVEVIAPLHNLVFGQDFPYKSYHKKKTLYPVYMYAYFDNDITAIENTCSSITDK